MARFGCLALAVVVALALLFFIVFLWSGWLNRPVGHAPAAPDTVYETPGSAPAERDPQARRLWGGRGNLHGYARMNRIEAVRDRRG